MDWKVISASSLTLDLERVHINALLSQLLANKDFDGFGMALQSYYADLTHQWHEVCEMARYEAFYVSVLYANLNAVAVDVRAEKSSTEDRTCLVVLLAGQVFVLEIKVVVAAAGEVESKVVEVLARLQEKGYVDKYCGRGEEIYLIAVVFSDEEYKLEVLRAEKCAGSETRCVKCRSVNIWGGVYRLPQRA